MKPKDLRDLISKQLGYNPLLEKAVEVRRTVTVSAHHHDKNCDNVQFKRLAGEDAERTANLLRQCGYQVDVY